MTQPPTYSLGHSEKELNRLRVQAGFIGPITRRFFVEAGIAPGMRVLDIGSGAGDVAFLTAELVGPQGEVVGTDRSSTALATARERASALSLSNVAFFEGDPAEMTFERPFDAIAGRYVLMFQADPTAMLRDLLPHLKPGGVVVFHEPYRGGLRSYPPVAEFDRAWELTDETFRRSGADTHMGIKLHKTFVDAGLPAPAMRMECVIAGGANSSDQIHFEMDAAESLAPEMQRLGIDTSGDGDFATLHDRVLAEATRTDSVIVGRADVGAWSRLAG